MSGSLRAVAGHMATSREHEEKLNLFLAPENIKFTISVAISEKLKAENAKVQAGIELVMWIAASLNMPKEPNPWEEEQKARKHV